MTRKRFKAAVNVRWAKLLDSQPPWIKRRKSKGRFAVGVRYERKVHEHLGLLALGMPGLRYIESPWIEFCDDNGRRWCQVDAILLDSINKGALIYEVKYQHCIDAWWQLTWLYEPVVRVLFPGYTTARMEVVHWHDPVVTFPQGYDLTESPLFVPKRGRVAVCIFNPGRHKRRLPDAGHSGGEGPGESIGSVGSTPGLQKSVGAA